MKNIYKISDKEELMKIVLHNAEHFLDKGWSKVKTSKYLGDIFGISSTSLRTKLVNLEGNYDPISERTGFTPEVRELITKRGPLPSKKLMDEKGYLIRGNPGTSLRHAKDIHFYGSSQEGLWYLDGQEEEVKIRYAESIRSNGISILDAWTKEEIKEGLTLTESELIKRGIKQIDKEFITLGIITIEEKDGEIAYKPGDSPYKVVMDGLWKD